MLKTRIVAGVFAASVALMTVAANAAPYSPASGIGSAADHAVAGSVHEIQYRGPNRRPGVRPAPGFRPGPGYRPGPPGIRPPIYRPPAYGRRYYGGPPRAWAYRPWYRRPYYGTIIGGIALGTILGVTAYGLAPRPPRPDLCWYWADPVQSQGYWDYC